MFVKRFGVLYGGLHWLNEEVVATAHAVTNSL